MTARARLSVWVLVTVLALALAPASVSGEGAPPGLTGGFLSDANVGFIGDQAGDFAGISVADAGDVNGDGYADFLIGARDYDNLKGAAYLWLGGPHGWQSDQGVWTANAIYTGAADGDRAGWDVAGAGDVNWDGYDDFLIGAGGYDDGANADAGRVYLVLGSASPAGCDLGALQDCDEVVDIYTYTGNAAGIRAGHSVEGAGDVNGDSYDDIVIGAPNYSGTTGAAYAVLGSATPASKHLGDAGTYYYYGEGGGSYAGQTVAGAGDVNGDGYADMLIGAYGYASFVGRVYVVLGGSTLWSGDLSSAPVKYTGQAGEYVGSAVAGGGDFNGDGYADMLIGAMNVNSSAGRVYVVAGRPTLSDRVLGLSGPPYVIGYNGEYAGDYAGSTVAAAGDVNADGYADFLVGADGYGTNAGRAYLVLGRPILPSTTSATSLGSLGAGTGAIYDSEGDYNYAGMGVGGGGDVNGDGYSDLLVGAYGYASNTGRAYLLYSDFNAATAARYRARTLLADPPPIEVGESGVTADYIEAGAGSIYVTRQYQSTCNQEIATNGLLWRVDNEAGDAYAHVELSFKYNDTQIAGMTEADLKLWGRGRPCGEWQEFESDVDTALNRVVGRPIYDPHLEFTLATSRPSPTLVRVTEAEVSADRLNAQDIGVLLALGLAAGALAWERRRSRKVER